MPTSNLEVAPAVIHFAWSVFQTVELDRPGRVLDVGPGRGKYGYLLREYADPELEVDAVEAWAPYVTDFGLEHIYRNVIVGDVLDQPSEILAAYDLVLMADVIEHIEKAPALELLDRIPGYIIVSTPRDFFRNPAHLPHTEAHISHWLLEDFTTNPRFIDYHRRALEELAGIVVLLGPK